MIKNWKTALAAMGLVLEKKPTMLFEIDDANGKKLIFSDANDFSEVIEGTTVTAEDGEYVVTVDGIVTTITVLSGVVTAISTTEPPAEIAPGALAISPEVVGLFKLMGAQLEANEKTIAEMKFQFTELKATMSHGDDDNNTILPKSRFNTNQIKK